MIQGRWKTTDDRHLRTLFGLGAAGLLSDAQLLERFASCEGDSAELAFAALVDRHGAMVLRACRGSLRDSHAADDAFQATFLILARKARTLWVGDSIAPWLLNVACRVSAGARVAEARRKRLERRVARPESYREPERDEAIPIIHEEVARLAEPFRSAVVLCHLQGLTQHEAARRLDWPVGTLQSRLDRGRRRLRIALTRRGLAPSIEILPMVAVPDLLVGSTARAAASGGIAPSVLKLMNILAQGVLMTKLKFTGAAAIVGLGLVAPAMGLGRASDGPGGQVPASPAPPPVAVPSPPTPAPVAGRVVTPVIGSVVETTVRVKVLVDDAEHVWNNGTGTIIQSNATETTILTAATLLRPFRSQGEGAANYRHAIWVNGFETIEGNSTTIGPSRDNREFPAYPIAFDDDHNLVLIRINPGFAMPVAPVVPEGWNLKETKLLAAGCLVDNNATIRPTSLLRAGFPSEASDAATRFSRLQCDLLPEAEATGGGLFWPNGHLVGVCDFGRPRDKTGIYEGPTVIRRLIERARLAGPDDSVHRKWARPEPEGAFPSTPAVAAPKAVDVDADGEPDLIVTEERPRPWATAARIKVHHGENEWGFGSGTVIRSTQYGAIILASAHTFLTKEMTNTAPVHYRIPITVDLFDGNLTGKNPAIVRCSTKDLPAQMVDYDLTNDIALIRIKTDRQLPASPVVPADWSAQVGMRMITVGCSHGNDATAWDTKILDPGVSMNFGGAKSSMVAIKCAYQPKEGRSGGGLFTMDGYLAGVAAFADPVEKAGLYVRPEAIHRLLDRHKMTDVYARDITSAPKPVRAPIAGTVVEPGPNRVPSDQDRRIDELERKLDEVLGALKASKRPG